VKVVSFDARVFEIREILKSRLSGIIESAEKELLDLSVG
jgi:hypothetical protein